MREVFPDDKTLSMQANYRRLMFLIMNFAHHDNLPWSIECSRFNDNEIKVIISRTLWDEITFRCEFKDPIVEHDGTFLNPKERADRFMLTLLTIASNPFRGVKINHSGNFILSHFGRGFVSIDVDTEPYSKFVYRYVPTRMTIGDKLWVWMARLRHFLKGNDALRTLIGYSRPLDNRDIVLYHKWPKVLTDSKTN